MKLLCALYWSFTFLATCSSAYEIGIQYDVPFADLISAGCCKCYRAILTSTTKPSDITSCAGPYLFVGTQSFDNVTFVVGAYAPAAEVQKSTSLSNSRFSHGLYWHFDEKKAFGFSTSRHDRIGMISDSKRGYESDVGPARDLFWSLDQTHLRHKSFAKSPSNQSKWILNCPAPSDAKKVEETTALKVSSSFKTDLKSMKSADFTGPTSSPTPMPSVSDLNSMKYTFQPTRQTARSNKSMLEPLVIIVVSTFAPGVLCILMVVSVWYKRHWCDLLEATYKESKEPSVGMDMMRIMRISMKYFLLAITFPLVAVPLGISYCKRRASSVGNVTTQNRVNENEGIQIVVNPGGDINRKENSTAESLENPSAEMLI